MGEKFKVDEEADREVNIYAETANKILEKCYRKAGIEQGRGMYRRLEIILHTTFPDNRITGDYLKNVNTRIQNAFKKNAENVEIGFKHSYIDFLAKYADIPDYEMYNKGFKSFGIPVIYTPEPFGLFNLVRVTDSGHLRKTETAWEFIDQYGDKIEGEIKNAEIYTMAGDKYPNWIKVSYTSDEIFKTAYFAEPPKPFVPVQSVSGHLFAFLQKYFKV